jgi:type I restriction enzyme M protein
MDTEPRLISRADVARAAGVSEQAVSLWASRHKSFPLVMRGGGRVGYPVEALAEWLDRRVIQQRTRRRGDPPGLTYGQRFRIALGLAIPPGGGDGADQRSGEPLDRLWARVDRLRRDSAHPLEFEAVVLSLLCVREVDPVGWMTLLRASVDTVQPVISQVTRRLPKPLVAATQTLRGVPATDWWRGTLRQVVAILAGEHVTPTIDTFDYLLDRFAQRRGGSPDEYLVPAALAHLMVSLVDPQPGDRVHDPCCGPGTLLAAAGQYLSRTGDSAADRHATTTITGRATTDRTWQLAALNLAARGLPCEIGTRPPADPNEVDGGPGPYDVVLLNPPFGKTQWSLPTPQPSRQWPYGQPTPFDTASAWLQMTASMLAPGGRAAVIMPNRFVSELDGHKSPLREGLVNDGVLRCVITLPEKLFRETSTAVTVWVLAHPGDQPRDDLLLIDGRQAARADGTYRVLTEDSCAAILDTYRAWLAGSAPQRRPISRVWAVAVTQQQVRDRDHALLPQAYQRPRASGTTPDSSEQPTPPYQPRRPNAGPGEATRNSMLGAVPAEWWVGQLDQQCKLQPGPSGSVLKASDYVTGGDTPVVKAGDVRDDGVASDPRDSVSATTADRLDRRYRLQTGDVLLVRVGQTTRHATVSEEHDGWVMSSTCIRLRPGPDVVPEYLACYLSHPTVRNWLHAHTNHGSRSTLTLGKLRRLPLVLPPTAVQYDIVAAHQRLNDEIARLEELVRDSRRHRDQQLVAMLSCERPSAEPWHPRRGSRA